MAEEGLSPDTGPGLWPLRSPLQLARKLADRERVRYWSPLAVLAIVFLLLATAYNIHVPLYEAPDETHHVGYVDALQRTGRLPEVSPSVTVAWYPPLYHALGAGLLKVFQLEPPLISLPFNQDFPGEGNRFLHEADEGPLQGGSALSIHLLRGLSTLFGLGTVILVYLTALLLFPERRWLAWSAAATSGLLPQFAFIGGMVNNDTAVAFFAAATAYGGLRFLKGGGQGWLLVAAGALALGSLTKNSALVAGIVPLLALLMRPLSWRQRLQWIAVLVLAPIGASGWFYVRNLILYGDLFAEDTLYRIGLDGPLPIWHSDYRGLFLDSLRHSYWYTGGLMNVFLAPSAYYMLDLLTGVAVGGLVVLWRGQLSGLQRQGLALLALLLLLTFVGVLLYSVRITFQPQGRYLFSAQPALALLLTLGVSALFQRNADRDHPAVFILPVTLLGLNVGIFALTLPSTY